MNASALTASRCIVPCALPRASTTGRRVRRSACTDRQNRRSFVAAAGASSDRMMSIEEMSRPMPSQRSAGDGVQELYQLAGKKTAEPPPPPPPPPAAAPAFPIIPVALGLAGVTGAALGAKYLLDKPARAYREGSDASGSTVGEEYDAWTEEGILEYYWGEHIHLGYYTDGELALGAGTLLGNYVKDFKQAKFDFVDQMYDWSGCEGQPANVLDVGCGIGGTSRHLAKRLGKGTQVTGITLSPNQRDRATDLAAEQGVTNAQFRVMNALAMEFEDNTFDMVWACESGEHMPDKKKYVEEMVRVLKPGGTIVVATWCQRETPPEFTEEEEKNLKFLYEEWAHPYFVSIEEYERLMAGTGAMETVEGANWVKNTIASWRHSIWVGVYDPWPVVFSGPRIWYKTVREIVTLERMHRAFDCDLMTYGMIKGKKDLPPPVPEKKSMEVWRPKNVITGTYYTRTESPTWNPKNPVTGKSYTRGAR